MDQFYRFDNFAMRRLHNKESEVANGPQIFCRADDGWVALSRILKVTQLFRAGEGTESRTS